MKKRRSEEQEKARTFGRMERVILAQHDAQEKRRRQLALRPGKAQWFGLETYFDPQHIEATPIEDGGFMMGVLDEIVVVEVDPATEQTKIERIGALLNELGLKALIVHKGIEFLRLRACTPEETKRLDAIRAARKQEEAGDAARDPSR